MKPSDICTIFPLGSITKNSESEILALNIINILARTGDKWRLLTFDEYFKERNLDGKYEAEERDLFEKVVHYTISPLRASSFCKAWLEKLEIVAANE
jgi:hypothetical protein